MKNNLFLYSLGAFIVWPFIVLLFVLWTVLMLTLWPIVPIGAWIQRKEEIALVKTISELEK